MAQHRLARLKYLIGGDMPRITSKSTSNDSPNVVEDNSASSFTNGLLNKQHSRPIEPSKPNIQRAPLARPAMEPLSHSFKQLCVDESVQGARHILPESTDRFCPFLAIAKFPYKFVKKEYSQIIASAFFDADKIRQRHWELYYLWTEDCLTQQPIILVTESQLRVLICEINDAFPDFCLTLEAWHQDEGLCLDFQVVPDELKPQWLGISTSKDTYETLCASISRPTSMTQHKCTTEYKDMLALAQQAGKNKRKGASAKAQASRQRAVVQLQAARMYLSRSPQERQDRYRDQDLPVLVAIDVEAYERNHRQVTEVGIATLDLLDCSRISGTDLHDEIKARHFLVAEYQHLVNHTFVSGCPDKFEFGTTEIVPLKDLPAQLTQCFHHRKFGCSDNALRPILLVGHDIANDIDYCHQIGFSILNRSTIVDKLDTSTMYQAITGDTNRRSLGTILARYNLDAWNLHNAGNDAVYTLWAMLAMCYDKSAEDKMMID